ncbi:hypothetical protein [Nitrospirillum viridazoti]|uniref:Uncharacterized protein n=1 Tax=Nitrospirillum viridazoti CBAmc TaxID=1441467 RepID=A0A248JSF1_9PROT|nr:hypothetical protein [Nitrospirillum amazonense]ASG21411.1 hypothetical protein Y958_11655 [Nitrospirillum amazonense CBAmc]TWB33089.1 hypothetical protein FBZ91_115151 [Nitrospirillum amazonense]
MEFHFGAGDFFAVPLGQANPTPVHFSALSDFSIDIKFEEKKLYGQNQFPIAVQRGKGSIDVKVKNSLVSGAMVNSLFLGTTSTPGQLLTAVNEGGQPTANSYTAANGTTFKTDLGVAYASTAIPLQRVAANPTAGQYTVSAAGVYTFAAGDAQASAGVVVSYTYTVAAGGSTAAITSQAMGTGVQFMGVYTTASVVAGVQKRCTIQLNVCSSPDLKMAAKQDDYMVPEFGVSAYADAAGNVGVVSFAE